MKIISSCYAVCQSVLNVRDRALGRAAHRLLTIHGDDTAQVEPLTERELAVLRLIADGHSNREISDRLIISLGTAKWYVSQIFDKLGVHSRTQVILRARA